MLILKTICKILYSIKNNSRYIKFKVQLLYCLSSLVVAQQIRNAELHGLHLIEMQNCTPIINDN